MVFRPGVDIRGLLRAGGEARRAIGQTQDPSQCGAIEELERVVEELIRGDDWTRRLNGFLKRLTPTARRAFDKLVKAGYVPDALVYCLDQQTRWIDVENAAQNESAVYRPRLQELARQFRKLANACDKYLNLAEKYPGSRYPLDIKISVWLRDQAVLFDEFLTFADPRRKSKRTRAEWVLFSTMREIKAITGGFHDAWIASLLDGMRQETAASLKRWRSRQEVKWSNWQPPNWVTKERYPRLISSPSEMP